LGASPSYALEVSDFVPTTGGIPDAGDALQEHFAQSPGVEWRMANDTSDCVADKNLGYPGWYCTCNTDQNFMLVTLIYYT
jgi:hypothetical protein